ncbi:hypothetical protein ACS04_16995 [Streptomyces roseus]|uniref:Uncharacterized protein n=1 Tax=Streptomyces roseus TaxID=66430 RepID=A0A0J6XN71_9ACTN|nr:hypothetical protein ACS04_16995 [Streptomyces roseus]
MPAHQADQLPAGQGREGGVPAELRAQYGQQFGRGPAAGVPGGAGQAGQGPPDDAGVAGDEVAVGLGAVAQEQRHGRGGEPLVAAQVLAGRPVEPAQQVQGDVVRCVAQDVRHAPGQSPAATVFHGRRHRCPPCPRAGGRTRTPTRTRTPVRPHTCTSVRLMPILSGQRRGRCTFSRVEGPGAASAIQGPSPEGSSTPSSSQV